MVVPVGFEPYVFAVREQFPILLEDGTLNGTPGRNRTNFESFEGSLPYPPAGA
jgi:hypothetical protein